MKLWLRFYLRTFLFTGILALAAGNLLLKFLGDQLWVQLVVTMLVQLSPLLAYLTVRKRAAVPLNLHFELSPWLLLAICFPALLLVPAEFILRWLDVPYQSSAFAAGSILPIAIITTLVGAFSEEIGWRGFLLPELEREMSPLAASLLTGLLWGLWHVTKIAQVGIAGYLLFVVDLTLGGALMGYLFFKSDGALINMVLFHAVNNFLSMFLLYGRESITFYWVLIALKCLALLLLYCLDSSYFRQDNEPLYA